MPGEAEQQVQEKLANLPKIYELRKTSVCRHVIEEANSLDDMIRLCLTKYGIPTRSWTVGVGGYWWNAGGNIGCGFKGTYQILEVPNENSI